MCSTICNLECSTQVLYLAHFRPRNDHQPARLAFKGARINQPSQALAAETQQATVPSMGNGRDVLKFQHPTDIYPEHGFETCCPIDASPTPAKAVLLFKQVNLMQRQAWVQGADEQAGRGVHQAGRVSAPPSTAGCTPRPACSSALLQACCCIRLTCLKRSTALQETARNWLDSKFQKPCLGNATNC